MQDHDEVRQKEVSVSLWLCSVVVWPTNVHETEFSGVLRTRDPRGSGTLTLCGSLQVFPMSFVCYSCTVVMGPRT
eukprot:8611656-Pyramimonas_sp.AAC.1